jgi:aerobic carbon-monoxide dehydrogenase medium subunit
VKAPAFDYVRPRSLAEALALLREHGGEAKIIAGGQSLLPALNLRLLSPKLLIDTGGLSELKGIAVADGVVRIGALTRHVELMRSPEVARHLPLIAAAMPHLSHAAIRNRGTLGGNLAHADPASELPACCLALGARMTIAGADGERQVAAEEFFTGIFETALRPDEILVRIDMPVIRNDECSAFLELARRSGDYALVGVAAQGTLRNSALADLRLAFFGVGPKAILAKRAAAPLQGRPVTEAAIAEAQGALAEELEPHDDLQASAATRIHLARVLLKRAVRELVPGSAEAARRSA